VTPCANAELLPAPGNLSTVEAATLCLVNRVRAQHGVKALLESARLDRAALGHDQNMISMAYFNHIGPAGDTPQSRIMAGGVLTPSAVMPALGENLACAAGSLATPGATVASWLDSRSHLANILDTRFRYTGIAVVAATPPVLGSDEAGATYTEDFSAGLGG
jgi:uncharacterized protein YkwD